MFAKTLKYFGNLKNIEFMYSQPRPFEKLWS